MPVTRISDHALLLWMERAHVIPVETWRELMRGEVEHALTGYAGRPALHGPAFIVSASGVVVTYLGSDAPITTGLAGTAIAQAIDPACVDAA